MQSKPYGDPIRVWSEERPTSIEPALLDALSYVSFQLLGAIVLERSGTHSSRLDDALADVVRLCQCAIEQSKQLA